MEKTAASLPVKVRAVCVVGFGSCNLNDDVTLIQVVVMYDWSGLVRVERGKRVLRLETQIVLASRSFPSPLLGIPERRICAPSNKPPGITSRVVIRT